MSAEFIRMTGQMAIDAKRHKPEIKLNTYGFATHGGGLYPPKYNVELDMARAIAIMNPHLVWCRFQAGTISGLFPLPKTTLTYIAPGVAIPA